MSTQDEHPIVTIIRDIRDKWRVISGAMIGTAFEGSSFQRIATRYSNEADALLIAFKNSDTNHHKEHENAKTSSRD